MLRMGMCLLDRADPVLQDTRKPFRGKIGSKQALVPEEHVPGHTQSGPKVLMTEVPEHLHRSIPAIH